MANINAINLRNQIEQDRVEAHQEIDRKFNILLDAVKNAYDVGNLAPDKAAVKPPKTPKLNIVSASPSVNSAAATEQPKAPKKDEEQESYEQSDFFKQVNADVISTLKANAPDGLGIAKLIEGAGHAESVVKESVKFLLANGSIRKEGQKRGTKYHYNPFGIPSEPEDENAADDENEEPANDTANVDAG